MQHLSSKQLFQKQGFLKIPGAFAKSQADLLLQYGKDAFKRQESPWNISAMLNRWLYGVQIRSPKYRSIVQASASAPPVISALQRMALAAHEVCGFNLNSKLVELNFTVSQPGAQSQLMHSDVSPLAEKCSLATIWLSVQNIDLSMGPTEIWPGSHEVARAYLKTIDPKLLNTYENVRTYSCDGEMEYISNDAHLTEEQQTSVEQASNDKMSSLLGEIVHSCDSTSVLSESGDLTVMDCRVYHRGTANTSTKPRFLFNATFQNTDVTHHPGFTYHIDNDSQGHTIQSLLHINKPR